MEHALQIALWLVGLVVVWLLLRPRYHIFIRIRAGVPHVSRGVLTEALLNDVRDACREVSSGWIGGLRRGGRLTLRFNRRMPLPLRQRLRNILAIHDR